MKRWEYLCQFSPLAVIFFSINIGLLALLGFSFVFVDRGSGAYVVSLMSFGILIISSTFFLALIIGCHRDSTEIRSQPEFEWDGYEPADREQKKEDSGPEN